MMRNITKGKKKEINNLGQDRVYSLLVAIRPKKMTAKAIARILNQKQNVISRSVNKLAKFRLVMRKKCKRWYYWIEEEKIKII
jgi:predicted transcriptional regulator